MAKLLAKAGLLPPFPRTEVKEPRGEPVPGVGHDHDHEGNPLNGDDDEDVDIDAAEEENVD